MSGFSADIIFSEEAYMFPKLSQWPALALAFAVSLIVSYIMTPPVKRFAEKIGAMDIPKDDRRVHKHPVPRMGGLAIIMGFVLAVLLFVPVSEKVYGIVIGSFLIAGMGFVDDIVSLRPVVKFLVQIFAALVCVRFGLVIDAVSWPSAEAYIELGAWGAPLTMLWIVLCTNAINLIDGLDGLAVGVSAICSFFLLMGALMFVMPTPAVALILAALLAACLGFMPFNHNPAQIFMGDVGSQFLGFVLAAVSVLGLFKLQTVVTFAVPLADTAFAVIRRILHGQSPFQADKGHFHHRLLALGLSQKQAVLVLYGVSAIGGLVGLWIPSSTPLVRVMCIVAILLAVLGILVIVFIRNPRRARARKERREKSLQEAAARQKDAP